MRLLMWLASVAFVLGTFATSATRWAQFEYRTFDLAFYIQALWKLSHGNNGPISLLNVPLLGEHASVIVLPMVPLFALFHHPLLPVALQILAIASMAPVGYRIARHLGLAPESAGLMGAATLLYPATSFVALHEFHPEAFSAPFLLLTLSAFQRQSPVRFAIWFLATLACKENMTLLLATWCGVNAISPPRRLHAGETARGFRWALNWCVLPGAVAIGWAALYAGVLAPRWNGGNIEFTALYANLTGPLRDLPAALFAQLAQSVKGDLLTGMLLPLCCLPLLRLRWIIAALPILGQHLLSVRPSEWQIEFHYAAPLIPLFWMGACEAVAGFSTSEIPWIPKAPQLAAITPRAVILCCLAGQLWFGPFSRPTAGDMDAMAQSTATREAIVSRIPPSASVTAGLPYLSHLAEREELISLHHVLKGLKTLSRKALQTPSPTDVVIVDYGDSATFDPEAGYYHPGMRVLGGLLVPSSDLLLASFLRQAQWAVEARDSVTIYRRLNPPPSTQSARDTSPQAAPTVTLISGSAATENTLPASYSATGVLPPLEAGAVSSAIRIDPATTLLRLANNLGKGPELQIQTAWSFSGERKIVPWMALRCVRLTETGVAGDQTWIPRGLCVPEGWDNGSVWIDLWKSSLAASLSPGRYRIQAVFYDNSALHWGHHDSQAALHPLAAITLGTVQIR